MNKKFLSAILFGALLATTTSTFVSCKDYDDDINGLQEQIDGLKTSLTSEATALRNELASAKTKLESDLAAAKTSLQSAIAAKADQTTVDDLQKKVTTLEEKAKTIEEKITEINGIIATLATAKDLQDVKDDLAAFKVEVDGLLDKTLTSLVLNPDLYYKGIEAVQISSIRYNAVSVKYNTVDADGEYSEDKATDGASVQMTPVLSARYHMNPSSAVVPTDLTKYSFLLDHKTSRATTFTYNILKAVPDGGDLTVTAMFAGDEFATAANMVTTLALQVEVEKDKVVTSDYAAVYAQDITGFKLDNEKTAACDELYRSAAEAIEKAAIVKVAWNETVNLADYVQTHYLSDGECVALAEETLTGYGFVYKYELVGYKWGENKTSQSAHAALNGSELMPQLPVDGKAAAWGESEQSQATIGRKPLVRVTLFDTNSNKNVAVGYVKVEITATPGKNMVDSYTMKAFDNKYTLNCPMQKFTEELAWEQIEEVILADLGISKAEFKNNYKFEAGKLWNKAEEGATSIAMKADQVTVEEVTDTNQGSTTDVLVMTVNENYAYETFQKTDEISAIVRYAKNTGKDALGNDTFHYVYVTLTWAPSEKNVTPEGTIADTDKKAAYWFANDSEEAGYDEIHVNVNVPGDKVGKDELKKNMLQTFVGEDITISGVDAVYTGFQKLTTDLVFAPTQAFTLTVGTEAYTLVGREKNLYAKSKTGSETCIAKIVGDEIVYQNNNTAKKLLNAYGRTDLDKNVTVTVLVKEQNACKKPLYKLNNNTFDVKFLRPISVAAGDMKDFVDGVDAGAEGSKVDLVLNFTDWRGYSFANQQYNYYEHYGVTSIKADEKNIETTANGSWALHTANDGMEIHYKAPSKVGENNYGYVTYTNNNAEVHDFDIRIPFTVEYTWGSINLTVEFHVAKTVQ